MKTTENLLQITDLQRSLAQLETCVRHLYKQLKGKKPAKEFHVLLHEFHTQQKALTRLTARLNRTQPIILLSNDALPMPTKKRLAN